MPVMCKFLTTTNIERWSQRDYYHVVIEWSFLGLLSMIYCDAIAMLKWYQPSLLHWICTRKLERKTQTMPITSTQVKQRTDTIPLHSAKPPASIKSIFASKLHARDPLHWVICIRLIRWHGAHFQAVVIVMGISMLKIIDETSYL